MPRNYVSLEGAYRKWHDAITVQEELEEEMRRLEAICEDCEEGQKQALRELAHKIDVARGNTAKAKRDYSNAQRDHLEASRALAEIDDFDDMD